MIIPVAFNFAPRTWAFCAGQLMAINTNSALFSLLGTTYGGNGSTNFNLPDLRGRIPLSAGQGAGLSNYKLGSVGGQETVTLTASNVPGHTHSWKASSAAPTQLTPTNNVLAGGAMYASGAASAKMATAAIGTVGGQPHNNQMPFLCLNYIIALSGIFPSQN
jgi:microcystin-dependent protein